jgi:hypothetical protein
MVLDKSRSCSRSSNGAKRHPGLCVEAAPDFAALNPGYACYSINSSARASSDGGTAKSRTAILCSIAEEDCRDLMRPDAWAGNARVIGQDDDRALGIERTDDVIVVD